MRLSIAARGRGPALVHGHCVRLYSHSLSDDDKIYRTAAEREADAMSDPIARMRTRLIGDGILDEPELDELERALEREAAEAAERALQAPLPAVDASRRTCTQRISIRRALPLPPSSRNSAASAESGKSSRRTHHGRPDQCLPARRDAPRPADRGLRRGRGRCQPRRGSGRGQGQRRRLQAHRRTADRVRLGARLQFAAGRSQHCGPRRRVRPARHEAGGRNSILRLHLAGHAPDSQ